MTAPLHDENAELPKKGPEKKPPEKAPPPVKAPEPPPPTQATKPMEVHHHSHGHGKKTWKEYLFEFFMLFLAVFCGFLAEYYLEHKIEKERGKQFIESLYEDLKTDTARMIDYTDFDDDKLIAVRNLSDCYTAVLANPQNAGCLVNVIKQTAFNRPFIRTERTLKQLANAGGFRLLKKEDADSILAYDKAWDNFHDFQTTVFQEAQNNVRATLNLLLNFRANEQMFRVKEGQMITIEKFNPQDITEPILYAGDKTLLNKYFNELELYYRVTNNHKRMLVALRDQQASMIIYFKNKYHFD